MKDISLKLATIREDIQQVIVDALLQKDFYQYLDASEYCMGDCDGDDNSLAFIVDSKTGILNVYFGDKYGIYKDAEKTYLMSFNLADTTFAWVCAAVEAAIMQWVN